MIKVDPVLEIIETALWTGALKNEKPLSVMLIASVGSGKSEMLRKSYKAPKVKTTWVDKVDGKGNIKKERQQDVQHIGSVLFTTDSTPYVLYHKYGELLKSKQIKHIVIPDFLSILTKGKEAMPDTIRFYNSLIEEGICRIESRYSDFVTEIPIKIGLITAVSYQDFKARKQSQKWGALGFLSRLLPVSYSYSNDTKYDILKSTFLREYHSEALFNLDLPKKEVYVDLPGEYMERFIKLSRDIKDDNDELAARREKQLMTFVMALALKDGRDMVTQQDVDKMYSLVPFFNEDCTVEL